MLPPMKFYHQAHLSPLQTRCPQKKLAIKSDLLHKKQVAASDGADERHGKESAVPAAPPAAADDLLAGQPQAQATLGPGAPNMCEADGSQPQDVEPALKRARTSEVQQDAHPSSSSTAPAVKVQAEDAEKLSGILLDPSVAAAAKNKEDASWRGCWPELLIMMKEVGLEPRAKQYIELFEGLCRQAAPPVSTENQLIEALRSVHGQLLESGYRELLQVRITVLLAQATIGVPADVVDAARRRAEEKTVTKEPSKSGSLVHVSIVPPCAALEKLVSGQPALVTVSPVESPAAAATPSDAEKGFCTHDSKPVGAGPCVGALGVPLAACGLRGPRFPPPIPPWGGKRRANARAIHVCGLPLGMDTPTFRQLCMRHGTVITATLVTSEMHGYAEYSQASEAKAAAEALNGYELFGSRLMSWLDMSHEPGHLNPLAFSGQCAPYWAQQPYQTTC